MNNLQSSSYRDPSGFVFKEKNKIRRQINYVYRNNWDFFIKSGLYKKLVQEKLIIEHKECNFVPKNKNAYKIIEPTQIPFISYPYEWSFEQLKDVALLTLKIQRIALSYGMFLKDASAFNVQFWDGKPIFIDSLSFEKYIEGKPWIAYRQFCEHFLSPLLIAAFKDPMLLKLFQTNVNGIPIEICSLLLPFYAKIRPMIFIHIVMQSKFKTENKNQGRERKFTEKNFIQLVESLDSLIRSLNINSQKTRWRDYYKECSHTNYGEQGLKKKKEEVLKMLKVIKPKMMWDIGGNTGEFSKLASDQGIFIVSIDNDWAAVNENYKNIRKEKIKNILPLVVDITNPTPGIGWENNERENLFGRPHPDTILALAIIHHLAISNNLSFDQIAKMFSELSNSLIIEFVPKSDYQVQTLISGREDMFDYYTQEKFEEDFGKYFFIKESKVLNKSGRKIYLMIKK